MSINKISLLSTASPVPVKLSEIMPQSAATNPELASSIMQSQPEQELDKKEPNIDIQSLQQKVEKANQMIKNTNLRFKIDKRMNSMVPVVVQIVDKESQQVIKQYPTEEILKLMEKLDASVALGLGTLIDNSA